MKLAVEFSSVAFREGPAKVIELAKAIEEIGYDELAVFDHVVMGYPTETRGAPMYPPQMPILEALMMLAYAAAGRKSRHVSSNIAVTVHDDARAEALSYFTLYRYVGEKPRVPDLESQPVIVGQYTDQFVRTADGWRFAHRRADVGFVRRSALKG